MSDNYWLESIKTALDTELVDSTGITSQIAAQIAEAMRRELPASIPALVEGEIKKHMHAIPFLVIEAVKLQFGISIPLLVLELQRSLALPLTSRSLPQQAYSSNSRIFHLSFEGNLPKVLFTKDNIKDQGVSLTVELHDQSGHRVDVGPESSAKFKILVVNGDFKVDGVEEEDISKHAVLPREGKAPLLKGKYEDRLINGVASIGEIAFTDNSKSMRNGKFRLAAQVVNGDSLGVAIKGAVSGEVQVKEYRNMFNRKQGKLSPNDEVWHLVNIGRGTIRDKLNHIGVHFVRDLLQLYDNDPTALLQIFCGNKKKLKETVGIARSCSQPIQPVQPQDIPYHSQTQLFDSPYGKLREQTESQTMTIQTPIEAESSYSTPPSPGELEIHQDGFTQDSSKEPGSKTSMCTEKQKAMAESYSTICQMPMQAEDVFLPSTSANMHFNAVGADQGIMPNQPMEPTFPSPEFGDLSFEDYLLSFPEMKCRSPRWLPVRAILRFKIAGKVWVKEGPRAGKRQKRG